MATVIFGVAFFGILPPALYGIRRFIMVLVV
jgi:hypothetical protein